MLADHGSRELPLKKDHGPAPLVNPVPPWFGCTSWELRGVKDKPLGAQGGKVGTAVPRGTCEPTGTWLCWPAGPLPCCPGLGGPRGFSPSPPLIPVPPGPTSSAGV